MWEKILSHKMTLGIVLMAWLLLVIVDVGMYDKSNDRSIPIIAQCDYEYNAQPFICDLYCYATY